MNKKEFMKLLMNHDWWYVYSDDHRIWKRGTDQRTEIYNAMEDNEELKEVYSQYLKDHNM
jgi:hypothetical protein